MKMLRIIPIAIVCIILAGIAYKMRTSSLISDLISTKTHTAIMSELHERKEIDKLFTGFYIIPVLDISEGRVLQDTIIELAKEAYTPSNIIRHGIFAPLSLIPVPSLPSLPFDLFKSSEKSPDKSEEEQASEADGKSVVTGYCIRKYEVSVGYDKLLDILGDENIQKSVCEGSIEHLPDPILLTVNARSTIEKGKYSGECRKWDQNPQLREEVIFAQLEKGEGKAQIVSHSKKTLSSLIKLFCQ